MNQNIENTLQNSSNAINKISPKKGDSEGVAFFLSKKFIKELIWQMNYQFGFFVSYIVQGFFYPIFFVFYYTFFNLSINGKEKLNSINEPIIFISNHIGPYDSFIFDLFVPPFSSIPPFRFMGTTKFTHSYLKVLRYTGILHLIYLFFGVIKVTYGKGAEVATIPAANIIFGGGTVAIFPEGKIWTNSQGGNEKIGPFKWGAAILARNTGALVIPVSLRMSKGGFFRRKFVVNIGDPYKVDIFERPEIVANDMRERVVALHNK